MAKLILSTILGFLSGLGIGGGSLLILWLTLVEGMARQEAAVLNLLFFLPSAATALFFRRKQGAVDRSIALPAAIAGCLSAILFSFTDLNEVLLKKLFGGLLIAAGIRELLYKPK